MKLTQLLKTLQIVPKVSLVDETIQICAKDLQPMAKGTTVKLLQLYSTDMGTLF